MTGLAVFTDGSGHPLCGLLKPGFRHVFAAVKTDGCWLVCDWLDGRPELRYVARDDYDLAGFYRGEGFKVSEVIQSDKPCLIPFVLNNCVGMTKSVLRVRSWAVTPYQLYRFLERIRQC